MDKYQKIIIETWKYEREKIKKQIKENGIDKHLENKIQMFVERTGLNKQQSLNIKDKILALDEFAISVFMKDPKKQNVYEKILLKHLTDSGINAKKLPPSGKNALYCKNGRIKNIQKKDRPKELKSLDFEIKINNKVIYLVHKYTNEDGGAQDNQYNDVIHQLNNLDSNTTPNVWLCLDGPYYNKERIEYLKSINPNIKIVNRNNIIQELNLIK